MNTFFGHTCHASGSSQRVGWPLMDVCSSVCWIFSESDQKGKDIGRLRNMSDIQNSHQNHQKNPNTSFSHDICRPQTGFPTCCCFLQMASPELDGISKNHVGESILESKQEAHCWLQGKKTENCTNKVSSAEGASSKSVY